ncbi:MAG TPA: hypothetical protein V6D17_16605 [Candidatus Obscuribacterales bacterium]
MMTLYVVAALAVLIVPAFAWGWWYRGKQVVYMGEARCLLFTRTVFERPRKYALAFVEVPGHGTLLAELSVERANSQEMVLPVSVTVTRRPFMKPEIESLAFEGAAPEPRDKTYDGLALSAYYFIAGMLGVIWAGGFAQPGMELMQHFALYASALSLALSGFSINFLDKEKLGDISKAETRALGIPLGKGNAGLLVLGVLCLVGTVACFWTPSILILIPGLHCAFALGAVVAILLKTQTKAASER